MRYTNLKAFQKHLASAAPHNLSRVYFIAIANDFERSKVLHSILKLIESPDLPAARISASEFDLKELMDALGSPSLFGEEPVFVLDEFDQLNKKTVEVLQDWLKKPFAGYLVLGSRTKSIANQMEKLGVVLDLVDEKPWDKEARMAETLQTQAKNAGKFLSSDVIPLLFERLEKESALLENELDKLICYTGDRPSINREDVLAVSASSRTHTLWQIAEEFVWETGPLPPLEEGAFHGLVPLLRSQLQLGLKIAHLIESQTPADQWSGHLPKVWPKTLEKRSSQAARLGSLYFQKGLEKLYELELQSRGTSTQTGALLTLFRSNLSVYAKASLASQSPR